MAPKWLYQINSNGLDVLVDFGVRLRNRDAAAIRALMKADLTTPYRRNFTRMTEREVPGFYWSDKPHTVRIPIVRSSSKAFRPWLRDHVLISDRPTTERRLKKLTRDANAIRRTLPADATLFVTTKPSPVGSVKTGPKSFKYHMKPGWEFKAIQMKPNPKFELVVVNKHDRAALLKLLSEVDTETGVSRWLHDRTEQVGATRSTELFTDYSEWCSANEEVALGRKAFAQALVANGVVKLARSKEGERYELELRPRAA